MKILVIDDKKANTEAALAQLEGHEVIIATSFSEARTALFGGEDTDYLSLYGDLTHSEQLMDQEAEIKTKVLVEGRLKHPDVEECVWEFGSWAWPEECKVKFERLLEESGYNQKSDELIEIAKKRVEYLSNHKFDIVLSDLLMPASSNKMGNSGMKYVGQEMPIGDMIILAALKVGVKMVAVVTDSNHHDHPAAAAIDMFAGGVFCLGDRKVLLVNDAIIKNESSNFVKDWTKALKRLLEE